MKASSQEELRSQLGVIPTKETKIITHCMKGGRAKKASDALTSMGFTNTQCYSGSFTDWLAKGGQVEK